ncbi:hypothetical protein D0Z07_5111 [Hyphodiscus hymeniophilus]|uniref:Proteasome assembly chaperone 3 n=1 Tax=Hyphodiscus hymeniophilus TaxID=353542 RepID=A0A9P7AWM8_9HELO|nr:hypothetical protein D0Z07_5111 [Hyphodiscus hymeniophilus]
MTNPNLLTDMQDLGINGNGVEPSPFPAKTKQAAGLVNGVQTNVSSVYFADKILITISQGGRLSQWIQVPLSSASPTSFDTALPSDPDGDMLPLGHLTPKTLLGGGGEQRETVGHLYASQIASTIATRTPEENRTVLVGLGLQKVDLEREAFFDLLELVQKII